MCSIDVREKFHKDNQGGKEEPHRPEMIDSTISVTKVRVEVSFLVFVHSANFYIAFKSYLLE